jgi:hypothetical protein
LYFGITIVAGITMVGIMTLSLLATKPSNQVFACTPNISINVEPNNYPIHYGESIPVKISGKLVSCSVVLHDVAPPCTICTKAEIPGMITITGLGSSKEIKPDFIKGGSYSWDAVLGPGTYTVRVQWTHNSIVSASKTVQYPLAK